MVSVETLETNLSVNRRCINKVELNQTEEVNGTDKRQNVVIVETDGGSRWSRRGRNGEVEQLTAVLEVVDLHVQQWKGLSEAVRY